MKTDKSKYKKMILVFVVWFLFVVWFFGSFMPNEIKEGEKRKKEWQGKIDAPPVLIKEVDGCRVYSFFDRQRERYFTTCSGGKTETDNDYYQRHGKIDILIEDKITTGNAK